MAKNWSKTALAAAGSRTDDINFLDGAVLRSDDNGASWTRLRINDRQRNSNLEGVGFVDPDTGWVGVMDGESQIIRRKPD
ncbi:hypothetical protein [uncultured Roseovarius sp.]|uniref:hypothetical protein n=1 Tax=uncultured Roseovarius sp. TaxID=293344 RepID=UPI0026056CC2|nr:hypothetical protein [uncultured Roseovarius sp.]